MSSISPSAPAFFLADLARLSGLLSPAIRVDPDGALFLQPGVLPEVQTTYANLCSYGWANGWLVP